MTVLNPQVLLPLVAERLNHIALRPYLKLLFQIKGQRRQVALSLNGS